MFDTEFDTGVKMSAKKEYVKLTKEERATVLKSMSLLIKEGVQASDIVRQYSHTKTPQISNN